VEVSYAAEASRAAPANDKKILNHTARQFNKSETRSFSLPETAIMQVLPFQAFSIRFLGKANML
jgi:hypothetical protein